MNIALWVLQVALAWLCIAGGAWQVFKLEETKKNVASMRDLPRGVWTFLGAFGCVAGVLLIVPGLLHVLPGVTAIAAAAVAVQSAVISGLYLYYGDRAPLPYSMAMAAMAVLLSVGRFAVMPL